MEKYYAYHSLLVVIFSAVLIYCLMNQIFIPVLVIALIEIPLMFLNYKKNHPKSNRRDIRTINN